MNFKEWLITSEGVDHSSDPSSVFNNFTPSKPKVLNQTDPNDPLSKYPSYDHNDDGHTDMTDASNVHNNAANNRHKTALQLRLGDIKVQSGNSIKLGVPFGLKGDTLPKNGSTIIYNHPRPAV